MKIKQILKTRECPKSRYDIIKSEKINNIAQGDINNIKSFDIFFNVDIFCHFNRK